MGGASRPLSGFRLLAPYLWSAALSIGQRLVACKASTRCDALDGAPAGFAAVDARRPPHASRNFTGRFSRNAATPSRKSAVPAASTWLRSSSAITSSRLGVMLRTRDAVRPVDVSPGWAIGFRDARALVLGTSAGYRLPEPTRRATCSSTRSAAASLLLRLH